MTSLGWLRSLREAAAQIETTAIDAVARFAPWFAPLPTAYLVGRASIRHLTWPLAIAVIAALVIESLGLATTATALELYEYNQSKRKSDPKAPFVLAAVLVGIYIVVGVGLTVVLDTVPKLAVYAPAIFPALSLCGITVLALRGDHRRRLAAIAQVKMERKETRQARRAEKQTQPQPQAVLAMQPVPIAEGLRCWCGEMCPDGKAPQQWYAAHKQHHHLQETLWSPEGLQYGNAVAAREAMLRRYASTIAEATWDFPSISEVANMRRKATSRWTRPEPESNSRKEQDG